jgi:hypothetical protein
MSALRQFRQHTRTHATTWALKKVLLSFIVVGALSFFTLASTFAVLNSESSNAGGSITSGTLTLGNLVASGSTCFSYSSTTNSNSGCDAIFPSATLNYPGGTAVSVHVTITNEGSIKGSTLAIYMPSCTAVSSPSAPTPGGGSPCSTGGEMVTITETNSSWASPSCVYPQTSGTCTFLANTLNSLATTKYDSSHMVTLGSGGIAAGASRYFIVAMELPSSAANNLQGEAADFNLTWNLSQ